VCGLGLDSVTGSCEYGNELTDCSLTDSHPHKKKKNLRHDFSHKEKFIFKLQGAYVIT
jgi:hypothetical protein